MPERPQNGLGPALDPKLDPDNALLHKTNYDCVSCRIMGSAAFTGLGAYTLFSGRSQLKKREQEILSSGSRFGMRMRIASINILGLSMMGLALYRLQN